MYISKADPGIQDRTSPDRKIKYKDFKWGRLSLTTPSRWFAIQGVYESSKTGFRRLSLSAMGLRPGVPRAHDVKLCWIKHIGKIRLYHTYVLCILYTYIYIHIDWYGIQGIDTQQCMDADAICLCVFAQLHWETRGPGCGERRWFEVPFGLCQSSKK
jgi:hypothetical protein